MTALARVRAWLFDDALPFWSVRGQDLEDGGPIESLTLDAAQPSAEDFKRLRVVSRQLYVFSHAEMLGSVQAAAAADHTFDFLERAWGGPAAGWPRKLDRQGRVLDPTPDLYDHAFALFALGWRWRARRSGPALERAHATMDFLEARLRHPGGGFHAALPPGPPRQQNPHMHLTEAALALFEASGEARWRALADELVALFKAHMLQSPEGVLPEFFNDDWTPAAGDEGVIVEPGHQFEWAWILAQHQRLTGAENVDAVRALVTFAERHGVDRRSGAVVNTITPSGGLLDGGSRTWPNTERIKGWLGLAELTGEPCAVPVNESLGVLFSRHLDPAPRGCWIDRYDAAGRPAAGTIPTSTLYHVFLAFAEVLRLGPKLL